MNETTKHCLSWAVNRAKGDLDTYDFVTMCKRVVEISERATTIL